VEEKTNRNAGNNDSDGEYSDLEETNHNNESRQDSDGNLDSSEYIINFFHIIVAALGSIIIVCVFLLYFVNRRK
jgi:hypothetical protein